MGAVPVCGTAPIAFTGNRRSEVIPAGNLAFCQGFYFVHSKWKCKICG